MENNIIERHLHSRRVQHPQDLRKNVVELCKAKNLEFQSLELRNDIYVIRFRPMVGLESGDRVGPSSTQVLEPVLGR